MDKFRMVVVGLLAMLAPARADGPPPKPADFKIHVDSFGLKSEPIYTEEIIFREGRAYVFPSTSKEVIRIYRDLDPW